VCWVKHGLLHCSGVLGLAGILYHPFQCFYDKLPFKVVYLTLEGEPCDNSLPFYILHYYAQFLPASAVPCWEIT
jgi:hypothetical protein